jgi:hypothetical protein
MSLSDPKLRNAQQVKRCAALNTMVAAAEGLNLRLFDAATQGLPEGWLEEPWRGRELLLLCARTAFVLRTPEDLLAGITLVRRMATMGLRLDSMADGKVIVDATGEWLVDRHADSASRETLIPLMRELWMALVEAGLSLDVKGKRHTLLQRAVFEGDFDMAHALQPLTEWRTGKASTNACHALFEYRAAGWMMACRPQGPTGDSFMAWAQIVPLAWWTTPNHHGHDALTRLRSQACGPMVQRLLAWMEAQILHEGLGAPTNAGNRLRL